MKALAFLLVVVFLAHTGMLAGGGPRAGTPRPTVTAVNENDLKTLLARSRGRVVVLNLWATWCVPCVEEIPDLLKLRKEFSDKKMALYMVSIDDYKQLDKLVVPFLRKAGVKFETFIKKAKDDEKFINSIDETWSGAVPATFIFDGEGNLVHQRIDRQTYDELSQLIVPLLGE